MHVTHLRPLRRPSLRRTLLGLTLFMGVQCLLGMWYAVAGADGVDRSWLDGSPFHDYVVPGLVLGIVVGGAQFAAAAALWRRTAVAAVLAGGAGLVLLTWIAVQLAIIGPVSLLQPIVAVYGAAQCVLAWRLMR